MHARQLEVFCTLMQAGTVTGAAARLNISQPAVSQMLLQTEDQLGFKLFNRIRGRLVPTQEALDIFPETERIFSELAALRRRIRDMRQGRAGLVRIAASPPPAMALIPAALAGFRARFPQVIVRSQVAPMRHIVQMLRDGEISLGVIMNDRPHHEVDVETIGHSRLVCLLPPEHPLAAAEHVTLADLQDETLISYRGDVLPGARLIAMAEAEGLDYLPAIEIDVSISALPFVQNGLGIAVVDAMLPWDRFRDVVVRPFRPETALPVAILTNSARPVTGPAAQMLDCLRRAMPDLT